MYVIHHLQEHLYVASNFCYVHSDVQLRSDIHLPHSWATLFGDFLSAPFIAAESQHHEESHLIYGPFESTLLDQGFPGEHELDAHNPPLTGTPLCRL